MDGLQAEVTKECPICYQEYAPEGNTIPRQLPCGHVACTQCLTDVVEDDDDSVRRPPGEMPGKGIRCQDCFVLHPLDDAGVGGLPVCEAALAAIQRAQQEMQEEEEKDNEEEESAVDGEGGQKRGHRRRGGKSNESSNTSNLAAFLTATTTAAASKYDDTAHDDSEGGTSGKQPTSPFKVCSIPGCVERDVYRVGFCPLHTKRASLASVSAMVDQFQGAKLSNVSLKSDKVELRRDTRTGEFEPEDIAAMFVQQKRLQLGEAVSLIEASRNVFREEANIVKMDGPVMVVGDLHGQYFDLLNILKKWSPKAHNILFLGDYVDRGAFSCEVILHLLALKLKHPKRVFLIRGNHECSTVSGHFGFKDECKLKYGLTVYYRFMLCFQTMPIAAVIGTKIGRIFACHGGISPDTATLEDIEAIDRFAEPDMSGALCDILWADPMNEDECYKLTDKEYQEFLSTDFTTNQTRGCSFMFGYHAVQKFLRENHLIYMVRAHEVQEEGFRSHFAHMNLDGQKEDASQEGDDDDEADDDFSTDGDTDDESEDYEKLLSDWDKHLHPTVLTVFSAPNYCDRYGNKAAVLHIDGDGRYTPDLLESEMHPEPARHDENVVQLLAMGRTCPYMPTNFREFLKLAVRMGPALQPVEHGDGEGEGGQQAEARPEGEEDMDEVIQELSENEPQQNSGGDADEADMEETQTIPSAPPPAGGGAVTESPTRQLGKSSNFWKDAKEGSDSDKNINDSASLTRAGHGLALPSPSVATRRATLAISTPQLSRGLGSTVSALPTRSSLQRQGSWGEGMNATSPSRLLQSEAYRKAAARDGINEMHPEVLTQRIGTTKDVLDSAVSPSPMNGFPDDDDDGSDEDDDDEGSTGLRLTGAISERAGGIGEEDASGGSGPRKSDGGHHSHHMSLDVSGGVYTLPTGSGGVTEVGDGNHRNSFRASRSHRLSRHRESKTKEELADMIAQSDLTDLMEMDEDVEIDTTEGMEGGVAVGTSANDQFSPAGSLTSRRESVASGGRDGETRKEVGDGPSQILFTHEEIVVLKMIFSLFDRKGKNFISREDIVAYAEEGGDYAQLREVDACMEAIDADKDGKVGLVDYINFAARLKDIHNMQLLQHQESEEEAYLSQGE